MPHRFSMLMCVAVICTPFLTYAVAFWLYHVRSAETSTARSQVTFVTNPDAMYLSMYHAVGVPSAMVGGWLDF